MDNYQLAKLMRIERACIRRGNTCDRKCADCDLVQDDKTLIAAYDAVIKMLEESPAKADCEQLPKSCTYYAENDKKPCCTHDCDGCVWYV